MAKNYLRLLLMIFLGILNMRETFSQDIQFSQFYAAPIFLNPAMTGATELTRIGINYRNQWPGLNHSFNSYSAYIDHYVFDYNSGIGLIINGNRESLAQLATNEVGIAYSYNLKISEDINWRFGGQASFITRDAYFGDLVFGSMIDIGSGTIGGISDELSGIALDYNHRFMNYHFGTMFTTRNAWLGLSAHNITEPNVSFVDDGISALPVKYSVHGGYRFQLGYGAINNTFSNTRQERSLSLGFNYKQQAPFNQLDVGAQLFLDPLVVGVWYRGLPTKYNLPNNEAIIGLVGVSLPSGIDIGYSYDFTISNLNLRNSGGAHEISMRYSFLWGDPKNRNQRARTIPCFHY
jgi:type IX secretion system PorP/SprF family membrane protein